MSKKNIQHIFITTFLFALCVIFDNNIKNTIVSCLTHVDSVSVISNIDISIDRPFQTYKDDMLIFTNNYFFRSDKQATITREEYCYDDEIYWLSSYIKDNIQLLTQESATNDFYDSSLYKQLTDFFKNDSSANCIKAKDYFTEDSTSYHLLEENDIIIKYYGNSCPVLSKVKYVNYYNDLQPSKNEWGQAFESVIKCDSPIIYRESWTYQHNGITIEIVTASNFITLEEYNNMQHNENNTDSNVMFSDTKHSVYSITLLFYNNDYHNFKVLNLEECSYTPVREDTHYVTGNYYAYFFDKQNNKKLFPIQQVQPWDSYHYFANSSSYCFVDTNDDDIVEIIETPSIFFNSPYISIQDSETGTLLYLGLLVNN